MSSQQNTCMEETPRVGADFIAMVFVDCDTSTGLHLDHTQDAHGPDRAGPGPPGRLAGLSTSPSDSCMCQAPSSLLPPPPGSPLCPLHSLARALTCEIKRHFNYLSAKQQLERITAQQHPPSALCTRPAFCPSLQSPSNTEARGHGTSSCPPQHLVFPLP